MFGRDENSGLWTICVIKLDTKCNYAEMHLYVHIRTKRKRWCWRVHLNLSYQISFSWPLLRQSMTCRKKETLNCDNIKVQWIFPFYLWFFSMCQYLFCLDKNSRTIVDAHLAWPLTANLRTEICTRNTFWTYVSNIIWIPGEAKEWQRAGMQIRCVQK